MNTIEKVKIDNFWGDKTVTLKLKDDVNFLIGVNGSGKTTIINLIAATLKADYLTLNRFQFKKIRIDLKPKIDNKTKKVAYIEVEKSDKVSSSLPRINYKIKRFEDTEAIKYGLGESEDEFFIRESYDYRVHRKFFRNHDPGEDINNVLQELVNVSWLSIHRVSSGLRRREERSFESTIDLKIEELQIELVKYFSQLNRRYSIETEQFQKYIFESLIESPVEESLFALNQNIDPEKEKNSLKQIFLYFKLNQKNTIIKLDSYFNSYHKSLVKLEEKKQITITDLSYFLGVNKIHSVVQEWSKVIEKQKNINKSRETFLEVINNLLQRKQLFINEKNELTVKTQSGKIFMLTNLSSGEKQLLIILGQSLLQEENTHIYIADEPELSLHVEWQEKLVSSLKSLNPNSQIIFATHSPDIVGEFNDSVIKVEEAIK